MRIERYTESDFSLFRNRIQSFGRRYIFFKSIQVDTSFVFTVSYKVESFVQSIFRRAFEGLYCFFTKKSYQGFYRQAREESRITLEYCMTSEDSSVSIQNFYQKVGAVFEDHLQASDQKNYLKYIEDLRNSDV